MSHKHSLTAVVLIFVLAALPVLLGCTGTTGVSSAKSEITVFAGSASKPPLDEAAQVFEKKTGIKVYISYGGSGTMLSQMLISKTGDVYIPGSPDYLAKAEKDNIIDTSSISKIAYLIPVISVQHGNPKNIQSLSDLAEPGIKVGIGNPSTVCVGLYAIEILDKNGLLEDIYRNVVTNAESCEKTATLISLKSVDAVIGWDVFHYWDPQNIDTIYLKSGQLPRIAYIPAAMTTFSKNKSAAGAFIDFLVSKTGQDIFKKWGYVTNEGDALKLAPGSTIGGEYILPASYQNLLK